MAICHMLVRHMAFCIRTMMEGLIIMKKEAKRSIQTIIKEAACSHELNMIWPAFDEVNAATESTSNDSSIRSRPAQPIDKKR